MKHLISVTLVFYFKTTAAYLDSEHLNMGSEHSFCLFSKAFVPIYSHFKVVCISGVTLKGNFSFQSFFPFSSAVLIRRKGISLPHQSPLAILETSPYRSQPDTACVIQCVKKKQVNCWVCTYWFALEVLH